MKIELLGIEISIESKEQILEELKHRVESGKKTFIVTPYSEFFYRGFFDLDFKKVLNRADFAIPDGIAVQWIAYFLSTPLSAKNYYLKILEASWQALYTTSQILLRPVKLKRIIKHKISGADFFWDLVELANHKHLSIFLLGGFGNTSELTVKKITERFPNVRIAGISNSKPTDQSLTTTVNNANTDILMVAFGPVRQEKWIDEHFKDLNIKVAIGLGGTFDYIAGKKKSPPKWVRSVGLEWLFRLFTQPYRFKRIWNATFGLVRGAMRYKVFSSQPFRPNAVGVIINQQNQVFVAKRVMRHISDTKTHPEDVLGIAAEHWQFPQGGIDLKEDPDKAAEREIFEETNISDVQLLGKSDKTNTYLWNQTLRPLWGNDLKFKGQEQQIYYFKYSGDGSEIKVDDDEFCEYKWIPAGDLEKVVHPERAGLVRIVKEEIGKYL